MPYGKSAKRPVKSAPKKGNALPAKVEKPIKGKNRRGSK